MKYAQLGKSDLHISRVGFGCMSLKGSQNEIEKILHAAIAAGINYFDTADLYDKGANEKAVGKALATCRQKVIIATKVGNQWRPDGSGWDWNPSKQYIVSAAEASLKRLQTDCIDLYQLHGGTLDDPIDDTIDAFELLKKQGKIRHYGISSIRPNVIRQWIQRSRMVSVMCQYSLLDRRPEEMVLPLLQQHQAGVLARGTLASGLLVNKTAKAYLNYDEQQVKAAATAVQSISGAGRPAAQTALGFVLQNPQITAAIVGIRTPEQLNEAVDAIKAPPLSELELKTLRQSVKVNYYEQHR